MNANDYVMNETIMNDLIEQLKGNPKALDIMTDFCTAFMFMLMILKLLLVIPILMADLYI